MRAVVPESAAPPPLAMAEPRASRLRAFKRLFVWLGVLLRFGLGTAWDQVRGLNTVERRAGRLRSVLERAGGTFLRIGQALAMRADLVPWAYGVELSRVLDREPAFPLPLAVAAIEAAAGRPLPDVFDEFDPEPIASSFEACIYQAILRDGGEKVVVKVQRPGVRDRILADLKVCDWLATLLECSTLVRAGSTSRMRRELRATLLDEIDLVREAREQDLFRRLARQSGRRFFTAPRVYFDLSSDAVIVQAFAAGMWLWELLAAVEQDNGEVLALARTLDIDPAVVARRLVWINYWSWHQNLFFLADPHPANVIVGAGGTLTFIDFTATGSIEHPIRQALQQNMLYARRGDPLNMARASIALLQPLPPVDVLELTAELEGFNWQQLYVFAARPGPRAAFDRSSAVQWLGLLQTARKFGITVESGVLRLLRATVLVESTAMRLDPTLDLLDVYRRFSRWRARRAATRLRQLVMDPAGHGVNETLALRLEQLGKAGVGLFFRLRHALTLPRMGFSALMSKGAFVVNAAIRMATQAGIAALLLTAGSILTRTWQGTNVAYTHALAEVLASDLYHGVLLALVFVNGRAMLFRLEDRDA